LSSDVVGKLNFVWSHGRQIKLKGDQIMEDNKISQLIQALKFFDLELEEITGQPGYEGRNKVIAIRKKDNPRILCAYSTYDELLD
jgi:hypothetical protein